MNNEEAHELSKQIIEWLDAYASKFNKESLIVDMTGGIDTALVASLCAYTNAHPVLVQFSYGMRPFASSRTLELVDGLRTTLNKPCTFLNFDLQNSMQDIICQSFSAKQPDEYMEKLSRRSLQSVLKTPVLDYISKIYNGLIVGGHNRDEDYFLRTFHRRGSGTSDLQPLADLHKSEIYKLAEIFRLPSEFFVVDSTVNSFGGDPTTLDHIEDDVILTSDDVEWGRIECEEWARSVGLTYERFVHIDNTRKFFCRTDDEWEFPNYYTEEQRKKMKKMAELEYSTRHKHFSSVPKFVRTNKSNL